jgi:hypothetical protein
MSLTRTLMSCSVVAVFHAAPVLADENTILNLELGAGNKSWSYAEVQLVTPLVESENSVLNFGANLMTHLEDENSQSNEKSVGLIYRQKLTQGSDEFWGVNASFSDYVTWDGNKRQTPHLGAEFYKQKYSFVANYMFQDKTEHTSPTLYRPHSYYGNILAAQEYFSGGWEVLGRYHFNDRFRFGLGYYDRFGDKQKTAVLQHTSYAGIDMNFSTNHQLKNHYLLQQGFFTEMDYQVGNANWSLQLKDDKHNGFLAMARYTYRFGGGGNSKPTNLLERAYRGPVYKADPDDFGIIAGMIAAAVADAVVEGAVSIGAVEAGSLEAAAVASAASNVVQGAVSVASMAVVGVPL